MNDALSSEPLKDFIRDRVTADLKAGNYPKVVTRSRMKSFNGSLLNASFM
jgi:hypothetical protein